MSTFTLYDAEGREIAGDAVVGSHMRAWADEHPGSVIKDDATGATVYPPQNA